MSPAGVQRFIASTKTTVVAVAAVAHLTVAPKLLPPCPRRRQQQQQQQQQQTTKRAGTPAHHPLAHFFARHGNPPIVCLQEHKIPSQQLRSRAEPHQAATVPGYESFWACCVDPKRRGLNGVVTYAKTGTVVRADGAPLGVADLDAQGRCIRTDHGRFVVWNVYLPNTGGHPMAAQMRFLQSLRRILQQDRQRGKAVVLVGDLNISHQARDIFWQNRTVHLTPILKEVREVVAASTINRQGDDGGLCRIPMWKRQIAEHWETIEGILETKQVVPTTTTNSLTKGIYNKYRLAVLVKDQRVFLGSHESSPDYCTYAYDTHAAYYTDEETGETLQSQEERTLAVAKLTELMYKLAHVQWSEEVQREIATTEAREPRVSPKRKWLTSVLEEDGMVDAFRYYYPQAEGRYTCWHQFTNGRYVNEGARIDYTLIDRSLLPQLLQGDNLRCCLPVKPVGASKEEALTCGASQEPDLCCGEEMALRAATAGGRFRPVSFVGGGIEEASQETLDTQFGPPHTGMVYTPPSFSDHIAVSALLDDGLLPTDLTLQSDAATRKAQPHKAQRTLRAFFETAAAAADKPKAALSSSGSTIKLPSQQPKVGSQLANRVGLPAGPKRSVQASPKSSRAAAKKRKPDKPVTKSSILYHFQKQPKS